MAGLKIKDKDGKWVGIPTIQGEPGPRGIPGKDGRDGVDGKNGINGKTPVKGTDYYTEADKQEMVNLVLAALPSSEGVSY